MSLTILWDTTNVRREHSPHHQFIEDFARQHQVSVSDLKSASKCRPLSAIRQHLFALLRERGLSYSHIGRLLGGRDHSTVHQGIKAHRARAREAAAKW